VSTMSRPLDGQTLATSLLFKLLLAVAITLFDSVNTRAVPNILFGLNSRPNSVFVFDRIILQKSRQNMN